MTSSFNSILRAIPASKATLAIVLSISLLATGCSAQWIRVALSDLPVLTQMALNIGTIVTTMQSGRQISAGDGAAIQNISIQASKDLNLLQALYYQYKANPCASALQKIQNAIADMNQNLPALLQAAHIGNPVLSARIGAAVNLILTTVASFAALIPQTPSRFAAQATSRQPVVVPTPGDLKGQWNEQVCGPTSNSALNFATAGCAIH
jgi:hypothetical protein